jgi:hypothetical protein
MLTTISSCRIDSSHSAWMRADSSSASKDEVEVASSPSSEEEEAALGG